MPLAGSKSASSVARQEERERRRTISSDRSSKSETNGWSKNDEGIYTNKNGDQLYKAKVSKTSRGYWILNDKKLEGTVGSTPLGMATSLANVQLSRGTGSTSTSNT